MAEAVGTEEAELRSREKDKRDGFKTLPLRLPPEFPAPQTPGLCPPTAAQNPKAMREKRSHCVNLDTPQSLWKDGDGFSGLSSRGWGCDSAISRKKSWEGMKG